MKSKILSALFIVLLLSLFCDKMEAQEINNVRFEKSNDVILVDIPLNTKNYFVDDNEYLVLTPRIESNNQSLDLLQVFVLGKNAKLPESNDRENRPYGIFTMMTAQQFIYQVNVSYQPWMDNASLYFEKAIYNINGSCSYKTSNTLYDKLYTSSTPQTSQLENNTYFAHLLPTNSKYDIHFSRKNALSISELTRDNIALDNISNQIDYLLKSGRSTVDMTIVVGTCVAGIYMDNEALTKQQALMLRNYFMEKYKNSNIDVDIQWISEDWDGLVKLVEQDHTFIYQQEVLNIINNTGIFTGRERDLMLLKGGDAYRYMKAHYFPKLWKAYCIIR